ncbi:hypothetical protein SAMN05660691_02246 [Rheinheimera pacifica]|uniref:Uncharacterized protein n=1 Tax=Rheinheimera pacifica TaxID=173990 RepID=A0A1H6LWB6_9GAMM|nr:hypothetical protein [Rheinheimera pacifica]SEH93112.1 hypothetical protein SAMN05660691_02246 [Rheinheimera pacifica]
MKKVLITALLLLSANLVLANEFLNKVNQQEHPHTATLSQAELVAQEELVAALSANAELP